MGTLPRSGELNDVLGVDTELRIIVAPTIPLEQICSET